MSTIGFIFWSTNVELVVAAVVEVADAFLSTDDDCNDIFCLTPESATFVIVVVDDDVIKGGK